MHNREKLIQEQRTIEAMKKGYIGYEGKFAYIAKKLGYPIISQGGGNYNQTFLDDFYDFNDIDDGKNELPIMDENESISEIGMSYEGLQFGKNLTIILLYGNADITVRHESNLVYKEVAGELEGFVPNEIWENHIDQMYEYAKKIEKKKRPLENEDLEKKANKKKKEILDDLKKKWGI